MGSSSSHDEQLDNQFFADASIENPNLPFESSDFDWEKFMQDFEVDENVDTTSSFPDQNSNSPSTKKRKRSPEDSASSSPTPPARKRRIQHPFQLNLPKQLSPYVIIDGQPQFTAPAPAPAPIPVPVTVGSSDSSKTMVGVAADSFSNSTSSERYLDSHRLRQQVKSGLAETHGINEGDKWECRLPGGMYLVECLRNGLCTMQWFGEVVLV